MDEKRSLFCTLPAAHSGPCQPEKPADPDDVRTESVARLRAEVESLQAQLAAERAATTEALILTTRYAGEVVAAESDLAAVRTDLSVARRLLDRFADGHSIGELEMMGDLSEAELAVLTELTKENG